MKTRFCLMFLALMCAPMVANAQHMHSDIEFGYDNLSMPTTIEIESEEFTSDGYIFFESEMEELDDMGDPGNFSADEPGFETNAAENLLLNADDRLWISVVDASVHSLFGLGYANYFDPNNGTVSAAGSLAIIDNTDSTDNLVFDGTSLVSGPNPQFIEQADSLGDIHDHVVIDLLDDANAPTGAYGVMFQLQADFASNGYGGIDATSDNFWIIFNHGMDEEDFESMALPAFGAIEAIPEPGTMGLLALGFGTLMLRRKR